MTNAKIACPSCGAGFEGAHKAGDSVNCPHCMEPFIVEGTDILEEGV